MNITSKSCNISEVSESYSYQSTFFQLLLFVIVMLMSFMHNTVLANNNQSCSSQEHLAYGLYEGTITFIDNSTEAGTINLGQDGSMSLTTRYEFPTFVGVAGVADLEGTGIGQWKSNCDGTYRYAVILRRQTGAGGGIPALFGYTNIQIPSLPNYVLVEAADFTVTKSGRMNLINVFVGFGDANYALNAPSSLNVLFPFTAVFPIKSGILQRQSIDDLYNAIPK